MIVPIHFIKIYWEEYDEFAEIPIYSVLRVQAGVVGTGSAASGLTIVYM